jgi:hypothetical protein
MRKYSRHYYKTDPVGVDLANMDQTFGKDVRITHLRAKKMRNKTFHPRGKKKWSIPWGPWHPIHEWTIETIPTKNNRVMHRAKRGRDNILLSKNVLNKITQDLNPQGDTNPTIKEIPY